jgi:hypothetical protein
VEIGRAGRARAARALGALAAAGTLGPRALPPASGQEFSGRVVLEVLEEIALDHKLRLLDDFSFRDEHGRVWTAPRGAVLDGWSVPRELRALPGLPLDNEYRKAAVLHDFYSRTRTEPWQAVHRMLHAAALAEGIPPAEASVLYMTVYASGWRWEPQGSSCYRGCHAAASMLAWRPDATVAELAPIAAWLATAPATLPEIEQRVDAALKRPGPHLFSQVRQ